MKIFLSETVAGKLRDKHAVSEKEVQECFNNRTTPLVRDNREAHATFPPTVWFISPTNNGRRLKVVFVLYEEDVVVKTVFPPSPATEKLYLELQDERTKDHEQEE